MIEKFEWQVWFSWFFNPKNQFSWFWLLEFLILGILIALISHFRRTGRVPLRTSLAILLPRHHPGWKRQLLVDSTLTLFNLLLVNRLLAWLYPFLDSATSSIVARIPKAPVANGVYGVTDFLLLLIVFPIGAVLFADFFYTLVHIALHKVPLLWRLHKLHHAPRSLSPATAWRLHPLEIAITATAVFSSGHLFHAVFSAYTGTSPGDFMLHGLTWFEVLLMIFITFRHTDVWISFGPLNYFMSSPAMHQIHHSVEPQHRDKNFALFLSFWDVVFGTAYIPRKREQFAYGLGPEKPRKRI